VSVWDIVVSSAASSVMRAHQYVRLDRHPWRGGLVGGARARSTSGDHVRSHPSRLEERSVSTLSPSRHRENTLIRSFSEEVCLRRRAPEQHAIACFFRRFACGFRLAFEEPYRLFIAAKRGKTGSL
jgi:hypothetical protein